MDKWILENRITTAAIAVLCVLGLLVYSNSGPKSFEECVIDNSKVGVKLGPVRSYCRKEFPLPKKCFTDTGAKNQFSDLIPGCD